MVKRRTGQPPKIENNEQEKAKTPAMAQQQQSKKIKKDKKKNQPEFSIFRLDRIFRNQQYSKFTITFADIALFTIVTLISAYTHFLDFGEPNRVVFDEVYFGNFTNYYHRKKYFFDIHPPLGKELLYLGSLISGYKDDLKFYSIDSDFPNDHIKLLRFWPSLTGTLITPVVYLMLRICDVSYMWATVGAILPALDNMLLVESRFVLIDAYLWFFAALSSLMCACAVRFNKNKILFSILTGIAVGATTSVKFTGAGVSIGAVIAFFLNYNFFDAIIMSFYAALSGLIVFIGSFYVHFLILKNPGPGCDFNRDICRAMKKHELSPIVATFKLIKTMLGSNFAINVAHPYSSKWWEWPLQLGKGNWLWFHENRELWTVGTPVIWYFAFFMQFVALFRVKNNGFVRGSIWIFVTYLISYLPFSLIKRVMWNYHYAIPLIFSIEMSCVSLSSFNSKILKYFVPFVVIVAALINYLILLPVTIGSPIDSADYYSKFFFKNWHY